MCPEGVWRPILRNQNVKNVWGLRPHTFSSLLLCNLGPRTPSGHNCCQILIFCFIRSVPGDGLLQSYTHWREHVCLLGWAGWLPGDFLNKSSAKRRPGQIRKVSLGEHGWDNSGKLYQGHVANFSSEIGSGKPFPRGGQDKSGKLD